jgi:hypothetical protein
MEYERMGATKLACSPTDRRGCLLQAASRVDECPKNPAGPSCRSTTRFAKATASGSMVSGFCTEVKLMPEVNRFIPARTVDEQSMRQARRCEPLAKAQVDILAAFAPASTAAE